MDAEIKTVLDEQAKTWEEFKSAHAELETQVKKMGAADAVTEEKLKKLNDGMDTLSAAKEAAEKSAKEAKARTDELEAKFNRMNLNGGQNSEAETKRLAQFNASLKSHAASMQRATPADATFDEMKAYSDGFKSFLRRGDRAMTQDEIKAMTAGSDNEGGYLVTPDMSGKIVTRLFDTSPMRQVAAQITIGTNELEGIYDTDEATSGGWVSETGTRAATAAPQLGKYKIPVNELFAMPEATQQLLDDANIDVESWLAGKVADKLTRVENTAFVTGTGVGQPRGITTYTTVATGDATRTWGQLEMIKTTANGDFASSSPADILFDLIGKFKQGYLPNARWATKREVIAKVRKLKEATTNAYMWQPGLQAGQPDRLLGYPIIMFEDLPALSANGLSMALGDFATAYQIVDRQGFRILRDPYTNKPYVRFYTTRRTGGQVVQFEALKFIQFSS
jgi:HK97 family phage major capsid protein